MERDKTCMDIRNFAEMVCRNVSEELGGGCQVKLQEVLKNNGIILQGLIILSENRNLSPTIYLNSFLKEYQSGTSINRIVSKILQIYEREMPANPVDMDFFRDFESVRPKICFRLVNRERNKNLLERIPHVDLLDLSICFYYAYENPEIGKGSITIYNTHTEIWDCNIKTLMREARKNTPRLLPWELRSMDDLLRSAGGLGEEISCIPSTPMMVLTNSSGIFGATCLVYPDILSDISRKIKDNLYIIPSSVHELILLPEKEVDDPFSIQEMICEVNATQVSPEDILSNSLYHYNRLENRIDSIECAGFSD